jgi:hypothetical protein
MYSPKISEEWIPILYRLAKEKNVPMTELVNGIIEEYLADCGKIEGPVRHPPGSMGTQKLSSPAKYRL